MKNILINGFGRIGRCVFRNAWERGNVACALINEPNMTTENMVYLLKYDSIYGRFPGHVETQNDNTIKVWDEKKEWVIKTLHSKTIWEEPFQKENIQIVVDATGNDLCAGKSRSYLEQGIQQVIVTNTFYEADFTYVKGHNDHLFDKEKHRVISTSICDANATIPLLSKLISNIGVEFCFATTLHPWLAYQNLMDAPVRMQRKEGETHDYFPLGRSAVNTVIPKSTTLGPVLKHTFPELENRLSFFSYRTPTQMVASAELSLVLERETTEKEIKSLLESCNPDVVNLNVDDIISIDCEKQTYSSIVDMRWLTVEGKYVKLVTWYDNEWGYCSRVIDLLNEL